MADFAAFADADFHAVGWVNAVLQARPPEEPLDRHVGAVAMKLQMLSHGVNDALEDGMSAVSRAAQRSAREVSAMERAAALLTADLKRLNDQLGELEASTGDSAELLGSLYVVRRNAATCRETLAEAARWTQLVRSASSRLAGDDLLAAAEDLSALQQSQEVLRALPEAPEREETLSQLRQKFEALVQPKLLELTRSDEGGEEELARFVPVCATLGLLPLLEHEYAAARLGQLHRRWFAASSSSSSWLPDFFRETVGALALEAKRCARLFGEERRAEVLQQLLEAAFAPLEGSLRERAGAELGGLQAPILEFCEAVAAATGLALEDVAQAVLLPLLPTAALLQEEQQAFAFELELDAEQELETAAQLVAATERLGQDVRLLPAAVDEALERCAAVSGGVALPALREGIVATLRGCLERVQALTARVQRLAAASSAWPVAMAAIGYLRFVGELCAAVSAADAQVRQFAAFEPDAIARLRLRGAPQASADLRALVYQVAELEQPALPDALSSASALRAQAASLAFDASFRPVHAALRKLPGLASWGSPSSSGSSGADPLPQPYLTEVGEHLLALLQQLEPFGDAPPELVGGDLSGGELGLLALVLSSSTVDEEGLAAISRAEPTVGVPDFSSLWLAQVAQATVCCFASQVLQVPRFTAAGSRQLAADVAYLANVLRAQDLRPPEVLAVLASTPSPSPSSGYSLPPAAAVIQAKLREKCSEE